MARQSKRQKSAAETSAIASGREMHEWDGQLCEIVGKETVARSDGTFVECLKIAVSGMPLHQGLRLVGAAEVKKIATNRQESN